MMWFKTKFEDKTSLKCMQFLTEWTIQEYFYILRDLPLIGQKKNPPADVYMSIFC